MRNVPSENILKLIELTDKLCVHNDDDDADKKLSFKIRKIVETARLDVLKSRTIKNKLKCYEIMCINITNVLNNLKNI